MSQTILFHTSQIVLYRTVLYCTVQVISALMGFMGRIEGVTKHPAVRAKVSVLISQAKALVLDAVRKWSVGLVGVRTVRNLQHGQLEEREEKDDDGGRERISRKGENVENAALEGQGEGDDEAEDGIEEGMKFINLFYSLLRASIVKEIDLISASSFSSLPSSVPPSDSLPLSLLSFIHPPHPLSPHPIDSSASTTPVGRAHAYGFSTVSQTSENDPLVAPHVQGSVWR